MESFKYSLEMSCEMRPAIAWRRIDPFKDPRAFNKLDQFRKIKEEYMTPKPVQTEKVIYISPEPLSQAAK